MSLGDGEISMIVERIRAGAEALVPGDRSHATYYGRDGELRCSEFDLNSGGNDRAIGEHQLREIIRENPGSFRQLLSK